MAIDERMRAKFEPASDIGNLIVPGGPAANQSKSDAKREAGPFGARTERTLSRNAPAGPSH